jgi:hypothetical protein
LIIILVMNSLRLEEKAGRNMMTLPSHLELVFSMKMKQKVSSP